ncbi:MAG: DinB family protein [Ginsengibacter sp.]
MKTIYNQTDREELIKRIHCLSEDSQPVWGRMNIYQMLKHCTLCEEMYLGRKKYKRAFIGRIFGRHGLKNLLKDEKPLTPNSPTSIDFKIKEINGDILAEKRKWISLINEYTEYPNKELVHWFFGKMTKEQVGYFVYKHTDHHLRQFGA